MSVSDIKKQMTDDFIANETVRQLYDLQPGKSFEEQFSAVSLESIIFFIVATANWLIVQLFERHKTDVLTILRENKAHTPNWYATRAKEFQFGHELSGETDQYDNAGLTSTQIETARIVKLAAAVESQDQSVLFVKIATETNGTKQPITPEQLIAFNSYLGQIKDAGVRTVTINSPADDLRLEMDIYYNPLVLNSSGQRLDGTNDTPVQNAIRDYISNLQFNGLYINQSLIDRLQGVQGVEIAELLQASSRNTSQSGYTEINARSRPYAGHYQITDNNLILNFIANE